MLTVYNDNDDTYQLVEEPDASFTYTYADYLRWNFEDRLELFRGRIFQLSAPNTKHQVVSGNIFVTFKNFLKSRDCQVFAAPFDVRLPVKNRKKDNEITTVVQPDICIICDASKLDARGCCGAPDLIVEILSPGNTKKEVKLKFELYQEAGVKEYWIVYPVEESIAVFILEEDNEYSGMKIYTSGDCIRSIAVQSLTIEVDDIFN